MVRFKAPQFQRRDGSSFSEGPRIVDVNKQPWDGAATGTSAAAGGWSTGFADEGEELF